MRRDAWPFFTHGLFFHRVDSAQKFSSVRFVAVDSNGAEWIVPSDSWSPIYERTLQQWFLMHFQKLPSQQRARVLGFLLSRAEAARTRVLAGSWIGHHRLLGPVAAPPWFSPLQSRAESRAPYTALRVYIVTCVPADKIKSGMESKEILAEFHR